METQNPAGQTIAGRVARLTAVRIEENLLLLQAFPQCLGVMLFQEKQSASKRQNGMAASLHPAEDPVSSGIDFPSEIPSMYTLCSMLTHQALPLRETMLAFETETEISAFPSSAVELPVLDKARRAIRLAKDPFFLNLRQTQILPVLPQSQEPEKVIDARRLRNIQMPQ